MDSESTFDNAASLFDHNMFFHPTFMQMSAFPNSDDLFPDACHCEGPLGGSLPDLIDSSPTEIIADFSLGSCSSSSDSECSSPQTTEMGANKTRRSRTTKGSNTGARKAHSLVEKKYRNSVNTALCRLQRCIPHLANLDTAGNDCARLTKSAILAYGIEYIKQLEKERNELQQTVKRNKLLLESISCHQFLD